MNILEAFLGIFKRGRSRNGRQPGAMVLTCSFCSHTFPIEKIQENKGMCPNSKCGKHPARWK